MISVVCLIYTICNYHYSSINKC